MRITAEEQVYLAQIEQHYTRYGKTEHINDIGWLLQKVRQAFNEAVQAPIRRHEKLISNKELHVLLELYREDPPKSEG